MNRYKYNNDYQRPEMFLSGMVFSLKEGCEQWPSRINLLWPANPDYKKGGSWVCGTMDDRPRINISEEQLRTIYEPK